MNVIPLSRFRADIQKSGSQRLREILGSSDVTAAVQALDPLELFSLVLDVGEGEVMEIMSLADEEQVRRVVDLGIGRDDMPSYQALDKLFMAAVSHGPGTATRFFEKLDEELQTHYLAQHVRVLEAPREGEELPDAPEGTERLLTPDGTFVIEVAPPPKDETMDESLPLSANEVPPPDTRPFSPLPLIADLYYVDWQRADTIMRDVRHAIAAELEETIVRVRDARLEEMGFPPRDDAAKIFARRSDTTLKKRAGATAPRTSLPSTYAEPFLADSFFVRALQTVTDAELLGQIESELVYLTNADCVIEGRLYGDATAVRAAARDVRNLLSLGLEIASQGNPEEAAKILAAHPLREVFSLGVEQSYKIGDWAKKADGRGLFRLPGLKRRVLAAEDEKFLTGLLAALPRFIEGAEEPRAFASRKELAVAQKRLETLGASLLGLRMLAESVTDFGAAVPDGDAATAEQLVRSAMVRRFIGASLRDTLAVSEADLRAFRDKATPAWPAELPLPAEVAAPLHAMWKELVQDISQLGESPDPRFVNVITKG